MAVSLQVVNPIVTQDEIDSLIGIENQIRHLEKIRNKRSREIFDRLIAGAEVEQGIHRAEIEEEDRGKERVRKLLIY